MKHEAAAVTGVFSDRVDGTGETYMGRPVVLFRWGDAFGCRISKPVERFTVCNGLVNQMETRRKGGREMPTPYWAVMDSMSVLGEFGKDEVVHKAMEVLRQAGYRPPRVRGVRGGKASLDVRLYRACETAWYVLKTHYRHPMKRGLGLGYMVENLGGGRYRIRDRLEGEAAGPGVLDMVCGERPLKVVVLGKKR